MIAEAKKLSIPAVILAGGKIEAKISRISPHDLKALLPILNKPMIAYILEALYQAPQITSIVTVGVPSDFLSPLAEHSPLPLETLSDQGSWLNNVFAGAKRFQEAPFVLFLAADIPLLTGEALSSFLNQTAFYEAKLFYPIIAKKTLEKSFPNTKRTYGHLREGFFTGGNIMLIAPSLLFQNRHIYEEAFAKRKSVLALVRILGFPFLLRLFLHTLTIEGAEKRISQILGARVKALLMETPELFVDVDKDEDLILVEEILRGSFRK